MVKRTGEAGKAFAAIDPQARETLEADFYALLDTFNVADDGTLVVPSEYLSHEMGHAAGMDTQAMVRDMRNRFWICLVFSIPSAK